MKTTSRLLIACFALISLALASPLRAEAEKRIAFVVGNAAYVAGPLATPANDAGLIAQTLQAAGFDVAGARDLDGEALRAAVRDFLDKAQASGPDTVAFVYLAGYGAQLDGENYFVPVDAKIAAAPDVAVEALRVSDYTKRLAGLALKASIIVLDAARASPFAKSGPPLAGGLALADAEPNMLLAFNAAPGTAAPAESGSYGAYAQALAEMIREGGLSPGDVFDRVRLRVNEAAKGAQVPWDTSRIATHFVFFERAPDAPPPAVAPERLDALRSRPLRELGAQDAYAAAIERDTLQGYEDFLAAYPANPPANRIRALVAARREAITWRRTRQVNTPDAYWSYLNRYPHGPHAADARRRLSTLAAAEAPPPSYSPIFYDVPPPPPREIVYVDRPVLVFDDPEFDFAPPPPIVFLAPPPVYLVSFFFLPPPPPVELFVLPCPVFVPVPVWVNPPDYVVPPPENVVFNNIHNTTVINNNGTVINPGGDHVPLGSGLPVNNNGTVINPGGDHHVPLGSGLPVAVGAGAGVAAAASAATVALPPSVAKKATMIGGSNPASPVNKPQAVPGVIPGQPGAVPSPNLPAGQALPGAPGKPLPGRGEKPGALPGQPGAVPSPKLPAGQASPGAPGKPLPGALPGHPLPGALPGQPGAVPSPNLPPGQASPGATGKPLPGALPGQPGAVPSPNLPAGPALPGAPGKPLPGRGEKPGALPGQPGALPSTKLPAGQTLPGANGKPLPGPGEKPVTPTQQKPQPALPGAPQKPPGAPLPNNPPAAHALPGGQQLPPLPGGQGAPNGAKPGRVLPPGAFPPPVPQPLTKPPVSQVAPQNGHPLSGPTANPAVPGPSPAIVPKPQQPQLRQQQIQQQHQLPQTYRPPPPQQQPAYRPPPQQQQPAYRPPPQQQPAYRPPPPQQQPAYRPPPPQQQPAYRPPPQQQQQQKNCGQLGLPPCH